MNYHEMYKLAKEKFGLVFKKRPKKEELENLIAEARAKIAATLDSKALRAKAAELRAKIPVLEAEAKSAEDRAADIEEVKNRIEMATKNLFFNFVAFKDIIARMDGLGLEFEYPAPLTPGLVEAVIAVLTPPVPPKRIYMFWVEGQHKTGRGYVAAESFEAAKTRWVARDLDYGVAHPGTCGWPAAAQKAIETLEESKSVRDENYSSTLCTQTLATHLYDFGLDGPEYEGKALVSANNFTEAKAKAFTGDILEGDKPEMDEAVMTELLAALKTLPENGLVEMAGHTLTAKTIQ